MYCAAYTVLQMVIIITNKKYSHINAFLSKVTTFLQSVFIRQVQWQKLMSLHGHGLGVTTLPFRFFVTHSDSSYTHTHNVKKLWELHIKKHFPIKNLI